MNRSFLGIVVAICLVSVSAGQQSYPMLMSLEPVAVQVGTTSDHVVKSRYTMEGAYEVLISGTGVAGQVVPPESNGDDKKPAAQESLTIRLTVAADAMPGVRDFRIATPNGVSTTGQLVVAVDPIVVESGNNDVAEEANAVELPATICGRIERAEDVDCFRFHADAGQTIGFHVRCMRLQDRIHDLQQHADPMLTIRNASGSTLAAADNVFAADPFLVYTFAEAGDYFLELRDVRYQGNQYWGYCIEANTRPFVTTVFPLAIQATGDHPVELIGESLGEAARSTVSLAPNAKPGVHQAMVTVAPQVTQPVELVVTDQSTRQERPDQPNDSVETSERIEVPGGLNGRIERDGDLDYFQFQAKKGQRLSFEVIARRAGSTLDPHLRILNASGAQQQLNDDARVGKRTFADSRIENWTVPADGTYFVEIRDVHLRGGPSFVYFLDISASEPYFDLFADTDKTPLTPGTSGVVYVRAEKKNGFDGEVQLQVDGLPEGVTATCGKILAGKHQDGCIVLTASPDAKPVVKPIRIEGVATVGDGESQRRVTNVATVYQEIYQPGGGRGHWPVDAHVVSIGKPGDLRSVSLSTYELELKPGESSSIDVEIERAEGFDKNVTLEVTYKHLSSVYGDPLPQGVTVDASKSKLLLTAAETQGKIVLQAAPNAQLADKQVLTVMANVSINFVMKATYASEPVLLTVRQQ